MGGPEVDTHGGWRKALDDHKLITALTEAISEQAERMVADGPEGLEEQVRKNVCELLRLLPPHFEEEEGPGGLYEDLVTAIPRAQTKIEKLRAEHQELIASLRVLKSSLCEEKRGDPAAAASLCRKFVRRISRHESAENELVYEAAGGRTIGTCD